MKYLLLIFFLTILCSKSFSQDNIYSCTISRNDYSKIIITNISNDSINISIEDSCNIVNEQGEYYIIKNGIGRKKDKFGDKEKWKKYLVNQKFDTLITIRNNSSLYQFRNSVEFTKEETSQGWKILNNKDEVVCNIKLLWNEAVWTYEIENFEKSKNIENLNKAIMLSLVDMAISKSRCECKENNDDDFWFILWVSSLAYK